MQMQANRAFRNRRGAREAAVDEGQEAELVQGNPPPVGPGNGPGGGGARLPRVPRNPVQNYGRGYVPSAHAWEPFVIEDSKSHRYAKNVLKKSGMIVQSTTANRHPLQAMERTQCIIEALVVAYTNKNRRLLNVYADNRESKFNDCFNRQLAQGETKMEILRYCPVIVHKDRHREPTEESWEDLNARADSLLYVDIYQQHDSETAVFDIEYVANKLLNLPVPLNEAVLYWVGRKFFGDVGVVPKTTLDEHAKDVCWAEGAWMRNSEGLIEFHSSPEEGGEYVHDPCDWIWKHSSAFVTVRRQRYVLRWSSLRSVGSLFLISFGLHPVMHEVAPTPWMLYENNLETVHLPATVGWKAALRAYMPCFSHSWFNLDDTLKVYSPYLKPSIEYFSSRRQAQTHLYSITGQLNAGLSLHENKILFKCFPQLSPAPYVESLALVVMTRSSVSRYNALVDNSQQFGYVNAGINSLLTAFGTAPLSKPSLGLPYVIAGGIILSGLYWSLRRKAVSVPYTCSIMQTYLDCRDQPFDIQSVLPHPSVRNWDFSRLTESIPDLGKAALKHLASCDDRIPFLSEIDLSKLFATYFNVCVMTPVLEEFIKDIAYFKHILPLFEFVMYTKDNLTVPNVLLRGVVFGLHYWFQKGKTFQDKVIRHASYNFTATTLALFLDPGFRRALCSLFVSTKVVRRNTASPFLMYGALLIGVGVLASCWNKLPIEKCKEPNYYDVWRGEYYDSEWDERDVPTREVPTLTSPISNPRVATSQASVPTRPDVDEKHYFQVENWIPDLVRNPSYFYHILPTCVPGYVPAVNSYNLNASITARMLIAPPMPPKQQADRWLKLRNDGLVDRFIDCLENQNEGKWEEMDPDGWNENVDDWLEHFRLKDPKKHKKYIREVLKVREGFVPFATPKSTEIFLKSNEMLMGSKNGKMALKPRFISNVDPSFQAIVGPYIYTAQKRMAETCPSQGCGSTKDPITSHWYSFSYGGAALDSELSSWMDDVISRRLCPPGENGMSVNVVGDDAYVALYRGNKIIWIVVDFKKYDSTQGVGPLFVEFILSFKFYGMPHKIAEMVYQLSGSKRIAIPKWSKDLKIFIIFCFLRWCRHSGGANTSFGNSTITQFSWFVVYQALVDIDGEDFEVLKQAIIDAFEDLGFEITIGIYDRPERGDFLKGMWYPTNGQYIWGPLPSRILKAGKSLRDPRELFPGSTMEMACEQFLNGVASGYAVYLQVPILRAFVNRYAKGRSLDAHEVVDVNPYATPASGAYRDWPVSDESIEAVCNRYSITPEDIYRVEGLISSTSALTFMSDPVFVALWELDYT